MLPQFTGNPEKDVDILFRRIAIIKFWVFLGVGLSIALVLAVAIMTDKKREKPTPEAVEK
jgi:uncharacterized protein involved in exopolysaccharide biosynthesis